MTELEMLRQENDELRADLELASHDPNWQIGSQFGFERRHKRGDDYQGGIAFLDIDEMKAMNTRLAHTGTDNILRCAFDLVRNKEDHDYIFRVKQGDELVVMVAFEDLPGLLARLRTSFKLLGISFTGCYAYCTSDPHRLLDKLSQAVLTGKAQGRRGETWEL